MVRLDLALAARRPSRSRSSTAAWNSPETYAYMAQLARDWNLTRQLHWITARPSLLEILRASGAWDHRQARPPALPDLHQILIATPSAAAHRPPRAGRAVGRAGSGVTRPRSALRPRAAQGVGPVLRRLLPARTQPAAQQRRGPSRRGNPPRRRHSGLRAGMGLAARRDLGVHPPARLPVDPAYEKLRRLGTPEAVAARLGDDRWQRPELGRVTWLRRGWPGLFEELPGCFRGCANSSENGSGGGSAPGAPPGRHACSQYSRC